MEQELLNALDGFADVWQRVLSGQENAHTAQEALEEPTLLDQAMELWSAYTDFARRTRGEARERFTALAEGTRETVRTLQTEHFLRTGDIYRPERDTAPGVGVLTGMRRAYEAEQRFVRRLEDNKALADAAARRAGVLRDMIAGLLRK